LTEARDFCGKEKKEKKKKKKEEEERKGNNATAAGCPARRSEKEVMPRSE